MPLGAARPQRPGMIPAPRRAPRPHTPTVVLAGRYGLLRLAGELDLETGSAIRDAVRRCLDNRPALLRIDISGVSFCDCSGIAALLWAKAEAGRAGTGFHLSGPAQPVVARVMDATGTAADLGLLPQPPEQSGARRKIHAPQTPTPSAGP
ncbi:STAS domain-containing protein [Streptomyces sp. H27-H5]|uniref:STAS domain-containing protein n=1 Tax=Streptomyces sp. H27-H5 TaxID=2996460 RepID=UPI00226D7934|nr:STAS domain-containing protein [Streptomyces sp. H27-H5]MCY0963427.1 STAS domain-containing protein [Streptomyces sp. H27-H5]